MPTLLPVLPVIELAFDPIAQIGDWHVRLQTLALAVVILVALLIAAAVARRTPVDVTRSPDDPGPDGDDANHLRRDDLLYIAVAAIPGAVVGGRLGYGCVHAGYYTSNPGAILDIGQGVLRAGAGRGRWHAHRVGRRVAPRGARRPLAPRR